MSRDPRFERLANAIKNSFAKRTGTLIRHRRTTSLTMWPTGSFGS